MSTKQMSGEVSLLGSIRCEDRLNELQIQSQKIANLNVPLQLSGFLT